MEEKPLFLAEYAKSGRAGCKGCSGNIAKESLRIAEMVQSPHFDGKVPNWYHQSCFFKKKTIKSTGDIGGYDSLKWEDQEKIESKIMSVDGTNSAGPKGKHSVAVDHDFIAEYAKSSRSLCKGCDEKIDKNVLRLGHMEIPEDAGNRPVFGKVPRWYHLDCFMEKREELQASNLSANSLEGYSSLKKADKDVLDKQLGKTKVAIKRNIGQTGAPPSKRTKEEQTELDYLKTQNEKIWKLIDVLKKMLTKQEMVGLLQDNNQFVPIGEQNIISSLSDAIIFGALHSCPDCKTESLMYSAKGCYTCHGTISEWSKCIYTTKEPKRKKFHLPQEVKDIPEVSSLNLSQSVGLRLFPKLTASAPSLSSSFGSQEITESGTSHPLNGFSVCLVGRLDRPKSELITELISLGAEVVDSVAQQTTIVLSSQTEVTKKSAKIKIAEKHSIPVLPVSFLEEAKAGDALSKVLSLKISDWGAVPQMLTKSGVFKSTAKSSKSSTKSAPKLTKMTVKGGGAVDPESGHDHDCHIYKQGSMMYSATLGMVDLARGSNSYYKLQFLEHDSKKRYFIFRSWGRVGTSVGSSKLETFHTPNNAMSEFTSLYYEKTGSVWGTKFSKVSGKFFPLQIDYGDEDVPKFSDAGSTSKLHQSIQDIIRLIFDVEAMKQSLLEMEIDLNKMPLGKLSKNQIMDAYSALQELEALINSTPDISTRKNRLLDLSNKFYTLIPHDFGLESPPILGTADVIKEKSEMLDSLLELEVSYSLLSGGKKEQEETDPIDLYYEKLKANLTVVDKKSDEFEMIKEFMSNTHGSTHSSYELKLLELFKCERHGEQRRYKPFSQLHNRQLLWHGSRATNFGGIISQGLRIAPPEAPSTGYMFGKGLYFADMVSKSANYCRTTPSLPTGLMLLCEVALGNMYELTGSKFITKLPAGFHSTKGVGRTAPDISGLRTTPEGVDIPMGVSTNSYTDSSSLLYNEFIVYDEAQVKMCYLLKVDFQYKSGFY